MNFFKMIDLFIWREFKIPKIIYRKLGKYRALGIFFKNEIHIDNRLKGKQMLEILIHESLHWTNPELSEDEVRMSSRKLTDILWKENYRKFDK